MPTGGIKTLASNTGALFALQLANYILPFLIIPFLTRTLGVPLYGVVAFGLAMVQVACIITDFGFNLSATRQIASHQTDREYLRKIVGAVLFCKILLLLPVALLFFLFLYFQGQRYDEYANFFWLLLIPVVGQTFQPIWFFQGIERMGFITIFVVLARSSYVLLAVILVSGPEDLTWVAFANGVAQVSAAMLAIGFMLRLGYSPTWPGWAFITKTYSESVQFFWSRAAVGTYTSGGAFYLGLASTPTVVAYYSAAEQLYKGGQALFQPVSQALYPYMTRTKDLKLFFRILKWSLATSLLGLCAGLLFGEWFLGLLFGKNFSESYPILVIFMITLCITAPSILLGYPLLSALGDSRAANGSVIIGGVIQISLLFFISIFDVISGVIVASTVLCTELFVLTYRTYKAKELLNSHQMNR